MIESDCLMHFRPLKRAGKCAEWCRVHDNIPSGDNWYEHLPEGFRDCRWENDRWPEPHEGIVGWERDDDLLSLEPAALARREIICVVARAFHDAIQVGNPVPKVERMRNRFGSSAFSHSNIQPGDLVIESTTLYGGSSRDRWDRGFGIYITDRWEWWETHEEWLGRIETEKAACAKNGYDFDEEEALGTRGVDHAWYVQYGPEPGSVCRWTNCSFIALPASYDMLAKLDRPAHQRTDGGGAVITRDSLLGSLADSGFTLNGLQ